jgi:hypothetical protein
MTTTRTAISRFMHSKTGRDFLNGIREHLRGQTIQEITFEETDDGISTTLHLNNNTYTFNDEDLELETIREQFTNVFRELDEKPTIGKET